MLPTKIFITLKTDTGASHDDFVSFWKEQYSIPNQQWYHDNISVRVLKTENLLSLFLWKNGMNLSNKKQTGFNNIAKQLDIINMLRYKFNESVFEQHFGKITPVWKIFLRHIIKPKGNPIFDQHVYRAFRYLHFKDLEAMPSNGNREAVYHREYVPFYHDMENNCSQFSGKEIDDALWAFGKFLSSYPKMVS